ncbi:hypothetical protein TPHA_0D02390 [Tetrapisispora phaffii CBS 4417]|uniref:BD-FAE-like domain-containing protein n=1 Tax=Tetrapisispora phaffii (strain ATCC 24235 / CBS 4417 / NBRC 1672 / NRRL Y-8282 / UCD 70-5) TaxID=1071381 RepID=G8BSQ5_TETPH|nr:hypothetical protein TPHA_0D02390 [Tetrapisispora phaffii CBS 4417]CCE62876.1 hypothetical protein TPHA_0D02390 [Tetrapisispora phaffii CBS 4417]
MNFCNQYQTVCFRDVKLGELSKEVISIIFIHGGAWVDPTNTANDFKEFSGYLNNLFDQLKMSEDSLISMFGINYRLSPRVKHPVHLLDVINSIFNIVKNHKINNIYLVGHSVGATLIWQILSFDFTSNLANSELSSKVKYIIKNVRGVFLLDGIYSIDNLLKEFPDYSSFVSKAFTTTQDFIEPAPAIESFKNNTTEHIKIYLVHSYQDELLSLNQIKLFMQVLMDNDIPFQLELSNFGLHNEVYKNKLVAQYIYHNIIHVQ